MRILKWVLSEAYNSEFLTSSRGMPGLLAHGPHLADNSEWEVGIGGSEWRLLKEVPYS